MFFLSQYQKEIIDVIQSLNNTSAIDFGGISAKVGKGTCWDDIRSSACNLAMSKGVFPTNLKYTLIIPIHKKGNRAEI